MSWKNFSIWRGRLPHWRADDVVYYVTFRHRRALAEAERESLLRALLRSSGKRWELAIACVLPDATEILFTVLASPSGEPYELSDIVEKAKAKAGKEIMKAAGEPFPPFFGESYDRIVRDQSEFEERYQAIYISPVDQGLAESPAEYPGLWAANSE